MIILMLKTTIQIKIKSDINSQKFSCNKIYQSKKQDYLEFS